MGHFGDWRSPFPLRFGGRPHALVETMYRTVRSARPDMLTGGEGTEVDLENQVMARMLAAGWRSNERRVAQRDPSKLTALVRSVTFPDGTTRTTSVLARWESVLGLRPVSTASERSRRAAVKAALVSTTSAKRAVVEDAMRAIYGDWLLSLGENSVDDVDYPGRVTPGDVHSFWPETQDPPTPDAFHDADKPGEFSATLPWASWLCHLSVRIQPPASVDQRAVDTLTGKALRQLDAMLPAWMTADVSQFPADQTDPGFYAGVSLVGLTAI